MSLADLAAAAHISVADYLGGIDWTGHEQTKGWYSGLKSRPSFRPLLAERMEIVTPPQYYEKVVFCRAAQCDAYRSINSSLRGGEIRKPLICRTLRRDPIVERLAATAIGRAHVYNTV